MLSPTRLVPWITHLSQRLVEPMKRAKDDQAPKREGKGREGKGREGKGREGKGREGKGREG
ncbi:hypothetical protein ACUNH4_21335, partial [Serratia sp. IR-2025]